MPVAARLVFWIVTRSSKRNGVEVGRYSCVILSPAGRGEFPWNRLTNAVVDVAELPFTNSGLTRLRLGLVETIGGSPDLLKPVPMKSPANVDWVAETPQPSLVLPLLPPG